MTTTTTTTKPMMKRKGVIAAILIAIVLIAAGLLYFAYYQPMGTSPNAPTVTHTSPTYSATGTPLNTKILVTFSTAMDPTTITTSTLSLKHGTTADTGTVSYLGVTGTFIPSANLTKSTVYTATVTTGAKDSAGHALAVNYVWSFTTGLLIDTTNPTVIGTSPVVGVAVNSSISATFSKAMDPATITGSTFTIKQGTTSVGGTVTYAGTTATFTPSSNLVLNMNYTATITTGAKDLAGNPLKNNFVWTFTTGSIGNCAQAPVALGRAGSFAVLGGSGVTNTGPTNVTGDVGVSPGTAVTGFPPGTATGTIYKGNNVTSQGAQADALVAYNDAVGRTECLITVAGNIGGQTLAPGLYKSMSTLEISSGDLTLDAGGNANAVYIFQVSTALTTTAGLKIILAGGAQAKNIFWTVGSSATLGTTSVFQGTIMAYASISITTGATLNGRALAQVGAVALDSNSITKP
jgi:hypothetical protein